jgi:translation initiation factor IF-2
MMGVKRLGKVRIYELAKELNTTSKRLIEKLAEIDIFVKNHMSLLEQDELKALYDHIGIIQQDDKDTEKEEKKVEEVQRKATSSKNRRNMLRNTPRIIRTTEIRIDSDDEKTASSKTREGRTGGYNRDNRRSNRDYVKVADDTSGLRAGFVRDTGYDLLKDLKKEVVHEKSQAKKPVQIDEQKPDIKEKVPEIKKAPPKKDVEQVKIEEKSPDRTHTARKQSKEEVKPLDIPKPELIATQKEQLNLQKSESKREHARKNFEKDERKELKKEVVKTQTPSRVKKIKPPAAIVSDKKRVSDALSEEFIEDLVVVSKGPKKVKRSQKPRKDMGKDKAKEVKAKHKPVKAVLTSIKISERITVKDFAEALKKTATEIIKKLMSMGLMVTLNEEIDFDTAAIVADEFNVKVVREVVVNEEDILFDDTEEDESKLVPRPPVVVVMGHVDHGKTSLLDAIRKSRVTSSEAGGITQHIGAYTVRINDRNITFLDTPGHEAFTSMRARGAQVTDIAILVVAADDGVMPQTVEAINHAKAANVSIIVAINKIDKPSANPDKVKQELTEHGLLVEEWGGDIIAVPVSAKNGENIDQLLEMVLLTADILELKANPDRQAKGTIIEAKLDKNRGAIATLLVQRGTLNVGDSIITGTIVGRIRAMVNDEGKNIDSAGPSTPVEILGLPEVPEAGDTFYAITDEKTAKSLVEKRRSRQREEQLKTSAKVSLDDLFAQIQEGKVKELNIIVKADVQGSVEAVKQSLGKLDSDEVRINIIHGGVGAVTESDVTLASVSNAIIIGFNVRPAPNVVEIAEDENVDIRLYRIIYDAIEDIEQAMKGLLDPTFREVVLGHAEVRQIFKSSGVGTIGGCYVTNGKIVRSSGVRVVRDGIVVHEGKIASLKRFKDDAREVLQGFECGISIDKFNDIKEGDILESFIMEEVERN